MPSWSTKEGSPRPLGCTWVAEEKAFNFAIYSKHAEALTLLLYTKDETLAPCLTYQFKPLVNRSGRVWHCRIPVSDMPKAAYYAYSVNGPAVSGGRYERHAFNPAKILLDPYARSVYFPPAYDRLAALDSGANTGRAALGVISKAEKFAWGADKRPLHDHDLVIYEMHVRGFTQNANSGVSADKRGAFAGVIEKIPYLLDLGITAVELMPVFQFDDAEPNYWGYMPLNFFALHHRYSSDASASGRIKEFKEMVKALHGAGIEVILDVVYNHTGEGNQDGPVISFKGIDNSTYYIASDNDNQPYANYTGTGNTLHCANRAVRRLVVDSLRYWAHEMRVDGFRFDLASVFSRNSDGSVNHFDPPLFGDIAADPALAQIRMITEPWDADGNYELGNQQFNRNFSGIGWRQWNDKFRRTLRSFVKSDAGKAGGLMTRLYGSSDAFPDSLMDSLRPYQSVNYIASHDGLTLYDLVSYNSDSSWDCGANGDKKTLPKVARLRKQQVKNFCCLLFLSNGTPMLCAGDEFMQTQSGDPNPYNVDSPKTWLDWSKLKTNSDVFLFFKKMIAFRKDHPSISRPGFWRDDISWYGIGPDTDISDPSRSLAYCLHGASQGDKDIYVMINAYWEPLTFTVQEGTASKWKKVIDTSLDSPRDFASPSRAPVIASLDCTLQPRSTVVLLRHKA